MKKEIWKRVPEFLDYQVSNLGNVKSLKFKKEKMLKFKTNHVGYKFVCLYQKKYYKNYYIGELVLATFIGPRLEEREASHLNNIRTDNKLCNLKWETPIENMLRKMINKKIKWNFTKEEKSNIKKLFKQLGESI